MDNTLSKAFEKLEDSRTRLTTSFTWFSDAQINWKPVSDAWSINEIVEHLVLSDENIFRMVDSRALQSEPALFRLVPREWRFNTVINALNKDVALPLPTRLIQPTGTCKIAALSARWEAARTIIRKELELLPPDQIAYFHPALGCLTAEKAITLAKTHNAYHIRQIESAKANKGFPK